MPRRRTIGLATLVSAGALFVVAFAANPVQATTTFSSQFGASGSAAGQFTAPSDIAINQTTGDVFVTDRTLHRVSKFNAAGVFQLMWGQDVVSSGPDNTGTGFEICNVAANPTDVCKTGVAGSASGMLSQPQGIGVDSTTGAVYVQDTGNIRVQKFDASGNFVLMWGKGVNQTTSGTICTAASGNTCIGGTSSGNPTTKEPSGLGVFYGWHSPASAEENRPSLTVDSQGYVYVGEANSVRTGVFPDVPPDARVQKFDSSGNFVSVLAPPEVGGSELRHPHSLAVAANGNFYVRDDTFNSAAEGIIQFAPAAFTASPSSSPAVGFWGENTGFTENPIDIDPGNQFILAVESTCALQSAAAGVRIVEYSQSGEELDCTIPAAPTTLSQVKALATDPSHKLYMLVDGSPDRVMVFMMPVATPPQLAGEPQVSEITTSKAAIKTQVIANLGNTTLHVEYGTDPCPCPNTTPESSSVGASYLARVRSTTVNGLAPDTKYHFRVVATNSAGSAAGMEGVFRTFPQPSVDPSCANNLARQQTHASLLLDCRAYELVSPEEQGGYDVESDAVPGQQPFAGYPFAEDRTLFGMHNGGIPGVGKPTNRGVDPYLATRNEQAQNWSTEYVGVPADAPSSEPFSSTLAGAADNLTAFGFGGPEICDPCFSDGSSGTPINVGDGIGQGMVGSIPVANPAPAGEVKKPFSGDGTHFVFGSMQEFEPGGNPNNGNVTIYDRDLETGTTQVASTSPGGGVLADGVNIAQLDISEDGSRILIGDLIGTDGAGNKFWHLYMHIGNSPNSIDLTPGTTTGVLYGGMTEDGTAVYFTSRDPLATAADQDTDTSSDLFRSDVGASSAELTRVSTGAGSGDTDACDPLNNSYNEQDWNVIPGDPTDCSVVAIGGGGGVASESGDVYFLSPETLDGNGTANSANLFLARTGDSPKFVTTLEAGGPAPAHNVITTLSPFTHTQGAAIDGEDGSMYVYDVGNAAEFGGIGAAVWKYNAAGNVLSSYGSGGKLTGGGACGTFNSVGDTTFLSEFGLTESAPSQIAVDNNPSSPSYGSLYVPSINGLSGFHVRKFDSSGACLSTMTVGGEFVYPGAVAVDHSSGKVYFGAIDLFGGPTIKVFNGNKPNAATAPTSFAVTGSPIGIAVDGVADKVYVANGSNVKTYNATTGAPLAGTFDSNPAYGVAVDPVDRHVFVDRGDRVIEYDAAGVQVGGPIGVGVLTASKSRNLAAYGGKLVVSNWGSGNAVVFSPISVGPGRSYDSPLVIDSVKDSEVRYTADFQTTPSGDHASFSSVLPLTGFVSGEKYEIYRYGADADETTCVSCNPTLQLPTTDARMASNGLSLSGDGRVFFTSGEPLVLRDTNGKHDVYEWKDGKIELISSGQDRSDSTLLTVTSDGTDVFFFTRETFAANDRNGTLMKLYDAREQGGFFTVPPPPGCRASDECHGAGTAPPPPIVTGTLKGTKGNVVPKKRPCRRGKVRRKGKCVSPKRRKHRHHTTHRHG